MEYQSQNCRKSLQQQCLYHSQNHNHSHSKLKLLQSQSLSWLNQSQLQFSQPKYTSHLTPLQFSQPSFMKTQLFLTQVQRLFILKKEESRVERCTTREKIHMSNLVKLLVRFLKELKSQLQVHPSSVPCIRLTPMEITNIRDQAIRRNKTNMATTKMITEIGEENPLQSMATPVALVS